VVILLTYKNLIHTPPALHLIQRLLQNRKGQKKMAKEKHLSNITKHGQQNLPPSFYTLAFILSLNVKIFVH